MADNELDQAGQRRFVKAFAATMHGDATRRKKGYVVAAAAAVVLSGGVAVGIGVVTSHKSAPSPGGARLSALGIKASSSLSPKNARATAASAHKATPKATKHPTVEHSTSVDPVPQGGDTQIAAPTTGESTEAQAPPPSAPPKSIANGPVTTAKFNVSGQISCVSGNSVEGVWVQASDGAGWAPWTGLGNGSTSDWSFTLPKKESYSLHIGCGGTTSSWAVADNSPAITAATSSFNCIDVAGESGYGTCAAR